MRAPIMIVGKVMIKVLKKKRMILNRILKMKEIMGIDSLV